MASTYEPIASTTLVSAASDITFSSIPGTYTDLVVVATGGTTQAGSSSNTLTLQVGNGSIDTGSNYSWTNLYGDGSSAGSSRGSNTTSGALMHEVPQVSNAQINPSVGFAFIMSYSNTNVFKTVLSAGGGGAYIRRAVSLWRSTSAVTHVKVLSSANLAAGFTVSLFGIKAA